MRDFIYEKKTIVGICTGQRLAFLPVSKARTNIFFPEIVHILPIYNLQKQVTAK